MWTLRFAGLFLNMLGLQLIWKRLFCLDASFIVRYKDGLMVVLLVGCVARGLGGF